MIENTNKFDLMPKKSIKVNSLKVAKCKIIVNTSLKKIILNPRNQIKWKTG